MALEISGYIMCRVRLWIILYDSYNLSYRLSMMVGKPTTWRKIEPIIEIDGKREQSVKLTSPPPTYKTVNFFTGKYYGRDDKIADADLRNILYRTSCAWNTLPVSISYQSNTFFSSNRNQKTYPQRPIVHVPKIKKIHNFWRSNGQLWIWVTN